MQALYSWDVTHAAVGELCSLGWIDHQADREDTLSYARVLIAGALENMDVIDETIRSALSNWRLERLALVDRAILRLSTYSLLFQSDMAAGIIIDEAVGLAKEFAADESFRFVNGVLDAVNRSIRGAQKSP